MASSFPGNIDSFANPTALKVDGVDLVRAAHVNDLQNAVLAVQNFLITPGTTFAWDADNFPDDTPIKAAILALDAAITSDATDLTTHINSVLIGDPTQHHANVIAVTAGGNLTSTRLQPALEELQGDIDSILSGGALDDDYVGKAGDHVMAGALDVGTTLDVTGATTLDSTLAVAGLVTLAAGLNLTGNLDVTTGNVLLDASQWVGLDQYAGLTVSTTTTSLKSKVNLTFQVDADDSVDGGADSAQFLFLDGAGSTIMSLDELGNLSVDAVVLAASFSGSLVTLDNLAMTENGIETDNATFHIDLDNDAGGVGERFFITKNDNDGSDLSSADVLLNIDASANLTTGHHILKSGIQETGYMGLKFNSPEPGNIFQGQGVNFKSVMTNAPSSITLTPISAVNTQNLSVVHSNTYGFFWQVASAAAGPTTWYGTYTTVGN